MNIDAILWAWNKTGMGSSKKLVLLSMAFNANEKRECSPSISMLEQQTGLDKRTIRAAIASLVSDGSIGARTQLCAESAYILQTPTNFGTPSKIAHKEKENEEEKEQEEEEEEKKEEEKESTKEKEEERKEEEEEEKEKEEAKEKEMCIQAYARTCARTHVRAYTRDSSRSDAFDAFWKAYPKKRSKGDALKAWRQTQVWRPTLPVLLDALERAKRSPDWTKSDGQFVPYPATWLRAHGWEDEFNDDTREFMPASRRRVEQ